jgi:hypothetical protein
MRFFIGLIGFEGNQRLVLVVDQGSAVIIKHIHVVVVVRIFLVSSPFSFSILILIGSPVTGVRRVEGEIEGATRFFWRWNRVGGLGSNAEVMVAFRGRVHEVLGHESVGPVEPQEQGNQLVSLRGSGIPLV